jgi:hypothetical protein
MPFIEAAELTPAGEAALVADELLLRATKEMMIAQNGQQGGQPFADRKPFAPGAALL